MSIVSETLRKIEPDLQQRGDWQFRDVLENRHWPETGRMQRLRRLNGLRGDSTRSLTVTNDYYSFGSTVRSVLEIAGINYGRIETTFDLGVSDPKDGIGYYSVSLRDKPTVGIAVVSPIDIVTPGVLSTESEFALSVEAYDHSGTRLDDIIYELPRARAGAFRRLRESGDSLFNWKLLYELTISHERALRAITSAVKKEELDKECPVSKREAQLELKLGYS